MENETTSGKKQVEWQKAAPEKLPSPTYWPFFLALGFAFFCVGILLPDGSFAGRAADLYYFVKPDG